MYQYDLVLDLLRHHTSMIRILKNNAGSIFLPNADCERFKEHSFRGLNVYTELARRADVEGLTLWGMIPKHHWAWHLADRCKYMNPRVNACLIDEYLMGEMEAIVSHCVNGVPVEGVPVAAMEKIRWAMHFNTVGRS